MFTTLSTHLLAAVAAADSYNPFDGIDPSFGPFSGLLSSKVGMLLALTWVLAFCYCGFHMVIGFATLARGRTQRVADGIEEGKQTLLWSGGAVMGLAVLPLIYGVLAG